MPKLRAYGADATLKIARETSYGVMPSSGWRSLDFRSTDLSAMQPFGEAGEAYQIDIMAGSSVRRTIATTQPQALYPAADQIADFGTVQAAVTCRIHQLSERVGRGAALEVTL